MSTSLSEQLKRLAIPQTVLVQKDKKRPSLLFDPKEAAGLQRETVYQIGLDGLEELILKNQVFEQFRNTLFHFSSKKFERSVHSTAVNNKLDKLIRKFLLLLSPYFLLNCSHKTLEWLINRYSIHEYNREDLLLAVLPYHEANIFVRVVQLMKFHDGNDSWFFLQSLQTPGVHLTKQQLLSHANSDVYFIKCTAKFVLLLVKYHEKPSLLTVAFNFYCTVFTGVIEYSHEVSEAQIMQMLPVLLNGLSSDIPDYCAASYVILGKLMMKTSFSLPVLNQFVEKIANVKVDSLKNESVLLLIIIYQSQKHYHIVPEEACSRLSQRDCFPIVLKDLCKGRCFIAPFMQALVKGCLYGAVKLDQEVQRDFMKKVLAAVQFKEVFIETFLSLILDVTKCKKVHPKHIWQWLAEILETTERQYPVQFDKEVYKILSITQQGKMMKRRKTLQKILKATLTMRCKFEVFNKLYHPNVTFRREALQYLSNNFDSLKEREKEMLKCSFVDRLSDDDHDVVKDTLMLLKKIPILSTREAKDVLHKLSYTCQQNLQLWGALSTEIAVALCENSSPDDLDTFVAIFPYLLPTSEGELQVAKVISKTSFVKRHVLLKTITEKVNDCDSFCSNVFDSLRNEQMQFVLDFVENVKKVPLNERSVFNKYLLSVILSCISPDSNSVESNFLIVNTLVQVFQSCDVHYEKGRSSFQNHINAARKGKFHIEAFLLCLKNMILKTNKPIGNLGYTDFHPATDFNGFFILLSNILFKESTSQCVQFFVNYFCEDLTNRIEFVLNLAVTCNDLSPEFLLECVRIVLQLLRYGRKQNIDLKPLVSDGGIAVAYVLALLLSKFENVRRQTFMIVEMLVEQLEVFKKLVGQKEEIIADNDQMPLIMFSYLCSAKDGRTSYNTTLLNHLVEICSSKNYPVCLKAKMMQVLSHVNTIDIFEKTSSDCLEILQNSTVDEVQSVIVARNVIRCQANIASNIKLNTAVWTFIEVCMKKEALVLSIDDKPIVTAVLLLEQLDKAFFAQLRTEVEDEMLSLFIHISATTSNADVLPVIRHIVKFLELDAKMIERHFIAMRDVQSPKLDQTKLKRRISIVPTVDILDTLEWRKGVTALEFIQEKKKIRNVDALLPVLFEILKKCLDFDEQVAVEYPKQLILSSILHLGMKSDQAKLAESTFNMELVVQCIRASQNPQTHYCALLVLAFSAKLFPFQVLHNIMAIFTFMGSSVLRHEDAYSFQVITKIMDAVIPILVKDAPSETTPKILRVFVDVLLDVPEHRRLTIYVQLLTKMGVDAYLHVFLLLVVESHVRKKNKVEDMKRLDIAADICREFSPPVVIESCINLVKYLKDLPDELEADNITSPLGIQYKTPKEFRHYKYTLIMFMAKLLVSKEFIHQVASLEDDELLSLEAPFRNFIINLLTYIHRISKIVEKNTTSPQGKYWKVVLHLTYDILDSVNALLTPQMFLLVIKGLMTHNFSTIRRRSIELLNHKLQNDSSFFLQSSSEEMYSLIPPLIKIIQSVDSAESDEELNVQTALLSLKLLVTYLVGDYAPNLCEILCFLTDLIRGGKVQDNVLASVILCVAELCTNLRTQAITNIPDFMPAILKVLKRQKRQRSPSLLLLSIVTALEKILETFSPFLSPYLEKLLFELSIWSSNVGDFSKEKLQPLSNKLGVLRQQIGSLIPPRVLIPALEESYKHLIAKSAFGAVGFLMGVLEENLNCLNGSEINANLPDLTGFFLTALQFRSDEESSFEQSNEVEAQIVKALTKLILKLSESTFKPLYYKLFDWAVRHELKTERIVTFYALSASVAESLKSLFVLFAGHFVNNAAQILDKCNSVKSNNLYFSDNVKNVLLLENVLRTLLAAFTYDSHKFVNNDRFQVLMQPLVDQLENDLNGMKTLKQRNIDLVTPCIVQFAVAAADDSLWKQLNYQILLKMKHNSADIRLISLHCLKEVVKKLGVDYLPLLPETIPVLAELLEDEEEMVEKACKNAVQEMEKILGEPIEKYFKA